MPQDDEIFEAVIDLPAGEREAFLDRACGDDPAQRARLADLLALHAEAGGFLPPPLTPAAPPPSRERPSDVIGRYKLLEKIGEGGCGVVWMAEQSEPVRRRVALKVIKLGMDTKEVIARFEAERQALALMDHPNIARVFDGGATDSGRPYFVMELVRGVPITHYCDQHQLTPAARLGLFIDVCRAVQHAHRKGVIHRDLKPSNILVTVNDGVAVPKVIDFGIAKATQGSLTEKTLFTAFQQMIGTPVYMSPEQADLSSVEIDCRSDVYALGVLLYELLTGRTPFDSATLAHVGLEAMRRTLREVDPPPPSRRLRTLNESDRASVAQQRGTEAAKLLLQLRGDLDWVVMRCLEKDRARRYQSATDLAADVERHLRDEVVQARPPSIVHRSRKFYRRHRLAVLAVAAVAVALTAGLLAPRSFTPPVVGAKSIAVLPFADLSANRENDYFAEGVHDDIITNLAKIHDLTVVARTSVLPYRDLASRNLKRIGSELGVATLLEGSVRRNGDKVHLNVQLIEAQTGAHRWAETFSGDASDIFALQASLTRRIAGALNATLTGRERTLIERRPTENHEAYACYVRAYLLEQAQSYTAGRAAYGPIIALYEQAVALDPTFVLPHIRLVILHGVMYWFGNLDPTPARRDLAQAALAAATRLAPDAPETHFARGAFAYYCNNDWRAALADYSRAEASLPNDASLQDRIAIAYRRLSQWPEVIRHFERAVLLDPHNLGAATSLVDSHFTTRRYARARDLAAHHVQLFPSDRMLHAVRLRALFALDGDRAAFVSGYAALPINRTADPHGLQAAYESALLAGDLDAAERTLADPRLVTVRPDDGIVPEPVALHRAKVAFLRGRKEEAVRHAGEAIDHLRNRSWPLRQAPVALMRIALAEAFAGQEESALRNAQEGLARHLVVDGYAASTSRLLLGQINLIFHRRDAALAALRETLAGAAAWTSPQELRYDPIWSRLRDDPEFEELLRTAKVL